ncbi:kelch repeat-containing protein [Jatrophihabitans sp.]|uniref:kelch repeat-containing protein n=1 Tax=Jatrophihabitans sp. TaxID=1932789 RepID=UPI0030C749CB|nr:Branched-chain amino acid transporter, amino acid-binding protein [Jatrophihabitans sp.]
MRRLKNPRLAAVLLTMALLIGSAPALSQAVAASPSPASDSVPVSPPSAARARSHASPADVAATALPSGCFAITSVEVFCSYNGDSVSTLPLSSGVSNVQYTLAGGAAGGGAGDSNYAGPPGGGGSVLTGTLGSVGGITLQVEPGNAASNATGGSSTVEGLSGGNGGGGFSGGGGGGAASVIKMQGSAWLVVAGGGGGGGGNNNEGILGYDLGAAGLNGGNGGGRTGYFAGSSGGGATSGGGAGSGGGGGGYYAGLGAGTGGHAGQGGGNFAYGAFGITMTPGTTFNHSNGYAVITFDRSASSLSATQPTGTVYAWGNATLPYTLTSGATGTVTVTDLSTGQQVCQSAASSAGSCSLSDGQLSGGSHLFRFDYSGDTGYQPASTYLSLTVAPDPVGVTVTPTEQPDHTYSIEARATPSITGGIADGTLSITSTPSSSVLAAACPTVTSPAPSSARHDVALVLSCTPALPPGDYALTATFTATANSVSATSTTQVDGSQSTFTVPKYDADARLTFAPSSLDHYGASTVGTVVLTPPTGAVSGMDGSVTIAPATGSSGSSCTANVPATAVGAVATVSCSVIPDGGDQSYLASYTGNSSFAAVASPVAIVSTTASTPSLTLTPQSGGATVSQLPVGHPLDLIAAVTDPTGANVAEGTATIYDGPVAPDGSNAVGSIDLAANPGGGTITLTPKAGTHTYYLQYKDVPGQSNYSVVTVPAQQVFIQPLVGTLDVTMVGDVAHASAAGIPLTVTAKLTIPTQDQLTQPLTLSPASATPCTRTDTTVASKRVITVVCAYIGVPGTTPSFVATYTDDLVATLQTTENTTVVPYSPTAVALTGATVAYGVVPVLRATVTPTVTGTAVSGQVAFTEGAKTLCTGSIGASAGVATASCSPTTPLHAGKHTVTASYLPDATSFTTASVSSKPAVVTVTALHVSVAMSTTQDAKHLTISVQTSVDGGNAASPTVVGSVKFTDGSTSCATVALVGGLARCVLPLPAAGSVTTLSATFVPTVADFVAGATPSVSKAYQRPTSGPCTQGFANLWAAAQAASGTLTLDTAGLSTVSLTVDGGIGTCDKAGTLAISADISLFTGTLTATGVQATVDQTNGLCLNSGSFALPAIWKSGALTVTQSICFPLTPNGGITAPVSGALALGNDQSASLPLLSIPGISGAVSLGLALGDVCPGSAVGDPTTCGDNTVPALTLTAGLAASSPTAPGATVAVTVSKDGSIHGTVTTTAIALFGTSVVLAGTIDRTGTGAISAMVSATLASPATPVPGLSLLAGASITLTGSTGLSPTLAVAGTARIGAGTPSSVDVTISGSFTSFTSYALSLDSSDPGPAWTPTDGLTFNPVLHGSLTRSASGTTFAVSAARSAGQPLATWAAPGGVTVTIDRVSLGGDATATDLGCPYTTGTVAAISGSLSVGGLSAAASGCFSLADRGWHIGVTATTGAVGGITLTDLVLNAAHPGGGSTAVTGSATATLAVGSTTGSTTVTLSVIGGVLVIGGQIDATSLGLPSVSTYLAYASAAQDGWQTGLSSIGEQGLVDLPAGVSLFGSLVLPAPVVSVLNSAHFVLPADATVTFEAQVALHATSVSFRAELAAPSGYPILTLPSGAALSSASVTYSGGKFGLTADGTVPGQDGSAAAVHLAVAISKDGSFSGAGSVTGLSLFGQTLDLSGSVSRSAAGVFSSNLSAASAGTITIGDATLSGVTVSVGSSGLSATGTLAVASTAVAFTAAFTNTKTYSLVVHATISNWTPAAGVTVNAILTGTLSHAATGYTYDFAAKPVSSSGALITITPTAGVTLAMNSLELSNGTTVPAGCTLTTKGDTWLAVTGGVSFGLGSVTGSSAGTGCFDLTKPAFTLTAQVPGANFGGADGKVTLSAVSVTITSAAGVFSAKASARLNVIMATGGQFSLLASLTFGPGGYAIGGVADLSSFLGGSASRAYLYYASAPISVTTGDPTLGTLALKTGVTVGLDFSVSPSVAAAISHLGIGVGAGSSLAATANLDLNDTTITLNVNLAFQASYLIQQSNGMYLRADTLALAMTLSPTQPSFGFVTTGTLHLPAIAAGDAPSDVQLTGGISIGTQLTAFLTITNWNNALGITGLNLKDFTIQGGITLTGLPLPSLAVAATVTGLPTSLASILGYQEGAPISIALSLGETSLLFKLSIGTKDSTTVALEPLQSFGRADLLTVNYAELYISPTGATIGQTVYQPGFSLAFQGTVVGVDVDVFAKIDPVAKSFYFRGSVGTINIGSLQIGPTTLLIDAAPSRFDMAFSGHLNIGPSTTQIGPLLRFSGYLKSDVTLAIGTSGISAKLNFEASVTGSNLLPQDWCFDVIYQPCDYHWVDDPPLTITADNIGFAIDSSGFTVDIPNTASSVTFPWPDSAESASARSLNGGPPTEQTVDLSQFPKSKVATPDLTRPTQAAAWQPTGSMGSARTAAAGLALADGRVLVAGGADKSGGPLASVELYDPATGAWTGAEPMHTARTAPTLVQLADGRVLVVGGDNRSAPIAGAELYNPKTGHWTRAGGLSVARVSATASVLADGRVLVAGGQVKGIPKPTVDIFDPAAGRWTVGPSLRIARAAATATTLSDGTVLVAGGMGASGPLASTELYKPATGAWTTGTPMIHPRFYAASTRLADGRVLVAGDASQAELYDPASASWSPAGSQSGPALLSAMVTLPNGTVLVAGGLSSTGSLAQVDVYAPSTNHWTAQPPLPAGRGGAVGAVVDGGALLTGGMAGRVAQSDAYVYRSDASPVPAGAFVPAKVAAAAHPRPAASASMGRLVWIAIVGVMLAIFLAAGFVAQNRRKPA